MHTENVLQLLAAALLLGAGIWLYRRRSAEQRYGSQSATLIIFAGLIMLILGLDLLEYRPSAGELGR
jgi:LPXTG-motif cell wall-anchored protein